MSGPGFATGELLRESRGTYSSYIKERMAANRRGAATGILAYELICLAYFLVIWSPSTGASLGAIPSVFLFFNVVALISFFLTFDLFARPLTRSRRGLWATIALLAFVVAIAWNGGTKNAAIGAAIMLGIPTAAAWLFAEHYAPADDVRRFSQTVPGTAAPQWPADEVAELQWLEQRILNEHAAGQQWTPAQRERLAVVRAAISNISEWPRPAQNP